MKYINWGIIGLGKIATKFATDLQYADNCELMAVASRDKTKAKEFAQTYAVPYYFYDYIELITSGFIDVVYIATPHFNHAVLSIECLKRGIAVLCEKPMAMSHTEALEVINTARLHKTFFMEAMWTRFIPAFNQTLQKLKKEKLIGELRLINANFGFQTEYNPNSRIFAKELGASALYDIGIYPVYLALELLGMPTKIEAFADLDENGVDKSNTIILGYENGAMAQLSSSFVLKTNTDAYIHGTKGILYMYPRFHHTKTISVELNNGEKNAFHYPYLSYGYSFEIEEVNKCLLAKKTESKLYNWEKSINLAKLLKDIRQKFEDNN